MKSEVEILKRVGELMEKITMCPSAVELPDDLNETDLSEFEYILSLNTAELLKKALQEDWQIKHIEFWIKVKNARNFERLVAAIEAL